MFISINEMDTLLTHVTLHAHTPDYNQYKDITKTNSFGNFPKPTRVSFPKLRKNCSRNQWNMFLLIQKCKIYTVSPSIRNDAENS